MMARSGGSPRASRAARALAVACCAASAGCAVGAQIAAAPDDFADYRAFRLATRQGARVALAQAYLERHPRGRWADDVRAAFEAEEPALFEAAKASRSRALDYVVDLPRGPHVEAARALLVLFDQREGDLDTLELLAAWRRTAAHLDLESARRRRVGEVVLDDVAALLDPATAGADLDDPPAPLAAALRGSVRRTWGAPPAGLREEQVFFVLPTPADAMARVAEVRLELGLARGRVKEGRVEGEDLFVRWVEAEQVRQLDASDPADRAAAAASVEQVLSGALEARLPAARCAAAAREGEILTRACDGWHASVRMGAHAGERDVISVQYPGAEIGPARPAGMR
ncbi:MAG TPA: hypothetical protein VE987_21065 [Polyangiaceae bacterium]|nr:hypothetical protein [Polyangiaceae bacterium]